MNDALTSTYRRVFNSAHGQRVLADLMAYYAFWLPNDPREADKYNLRREGHRDVIKYIMERAGIFRDYDDQEILRVIRALGKLPALKPKEDEL